MKWPRTQYLIAGFLDGHATTSDVAELDGLLRSSPEVLAAFVECAQLDHVLARRFRDRREREAVTQLLDRLVPPANLVESCVETNLSAQPVGTPQDPLSGSRSPVLGFLGGRSGEVGDHAARFLSPKVIAMAVATLLGGYFCVLALAVILGRNQSAEIPAEQVLPKAGASFATISRAVDSRWQDDVPQIEGGRLAAKEFVLEEGLVELTMDDGVHVVIEGPTRFATSASNSLLLKQGRLVANVPSMAIGFKVVTPTAEVIDLGTEFGVTVGENAETDVVVFRGKVQVTPQAEAATSTTSERATAAKSGSVRLRAGESRRITRAGISSTNATEASGARLVRTIPRPQQTQAEAMRSAGERGVLNFSFEADPLGDLETTTNNINAWQGTGGTWGAYNPRELQFPDAGDSGPSAGRLAEPADGKQLAYINSGNIYQTVGRLEANTKYILSVALGRRLDHPGGTPVLQLVNGTDPSGEVLATLHPTPPSVGTFEDVSLSFISGPQASGILTIVLSSGTVQAVFDNVRLTKEPVRDASHRQNPTVPTAAD